MHQRRRGLAPARDRGLRPVFRLSVDACRDTVGALGDCQAAPVLARGGRLWHISRLRAVACTDSVGACRAEMVHRRHFFVSFLNQCTVLHVSIPRIYLFPRRIYGICMLAGERKGLYVIVAPLLVTALLSFAVNARFHDKIPHSLESTKWRNLTRTAEIVLHSQNTRHDIVYALLLVHAMQTLFCFPLMHVTKMMYGYLFGVLAGCVLATAWEMTLVALFVLACVKLKSREPTRAAPDSPQLRQLLAYSTELRNSKQFYLFVMCVQLASIPLATGTALVLYEITTAAEFIASHLAVTFVMSLKDAWLGNMVARTSLEEGNLFVVSSMLIASTILPTVASLLLLGHVGRVALKMVKGVESLSDPSDKIESDALIHAPVA